jgi:Fic family protein
MTTSTTRAWPSHDTELRPWRSSARGDRADRTLTSITVSVPPRIADLHWSPDDPGLAGLLDRAARALRALDRVHGARLGAVGGLLTRTESVASSRIEHESASADDYGRALVGSRANASATAMVAATTALARLVGADALTERDLLAAHHDLMGDDPLDGRYAGRYRDVQNWIGGGRSPRDATHVPPPPELVPALMADLVVFLGRDDIDPIAQAAIGHAQFESIHPFTDGNGRIGRALVGAALRRRGLTRSVVAPIAIALAADRDAYFERLVAYRSGVVDDLVASFATALGIVADESILAALELDRLPEDWCAAVADHPATERIAAGLLGHPVLTESAAESLAGAEGPALDAALAPLIERTVLRPITARRRNRAWCVDEVIHELDTLTERITAAVRDRRPAEHPAGRAA